ncbi:Uncharacterized protein Fot_02148 [Forsythia ovata]|uniref:Uncharacterized protein n=1 Tax=Forsythia ovata TaxID=205694 RepID=A0ABD1X611_9LAMI
MDHDFPTKETHGHCHIKVRIADMRDICALINIALAIQSGIRYFELMQRILRSIRILGCPHVLPAVSCQYHLLPPKLVLGLMKDFGVAKLVLGLVLGSSLSENFLRETLRGAAARESSICIFVLKSSK